MIHADLDKILPEDDALEKITSIIEEVEENQELFIITKSGRPAAAIINIDYLEELTGHPVPNKPKIKVAVETPSDPEMSEVPASKLEPVTDLPEEEEPLLQEEIPSIPETSTGVKPTADLRLTEDSEAPEGPAIATPTRLEPDETQPTTPAPQTPVPSAPQPIPPMPTTPSVVTPAPSVNSPGAPFTPPPTTPTTPPMTPTQPTPATNQPYDNLPPEDPNSGSPLG